MRKIKKFELLKRKMKKQFYQKLQNTNIEKLAKKYGVARSTAYRWKDEVESNKRKFA